MYRTPSVQMQPFSARVCALLCGPLLLSADAVAQPAAVTPTFNRDIAPVVFQRCSPCHRPGASGPFPLLTYDDARARARQLVAAVSRRHMPPWKAEGPAGTFEGDRRLTDDQVGLFERWLQQGAIEGDPSDRPLQPSWPDEWTLGPPDLVLRLDVPYRLAPAGADRLRNFVLPIPGSATRFVRAWEFRTNSHGAVHHATLTLDPTDASGRLDAVDPAPGYEGLIPLSAQNPEGYFLGWTPGQTAQASSPDMAWRIEAGSSLIAMLHLRPTGVWESVDASVALYFSDRPPARVPVMVRLNRQDLEIPAGARDYVARDSYTLPVAVDLHAIQPHAHHLARAVTGDARLPDGTTRRLLRIPEWDFHWQDVYRYREPIRLPAGTELSMAFSYDNSTANRENPSYPPRRVTFGQRSTDEMADLWLQVVPVEEADRPRLVADLRRNLVPHLIDGYRRMIEADPANASLHDDLALLAVEAGAHAVAVDAFRESVRLRPQQASSHYNLGNALLLLRRPSEAAAAFRDALARDPVHGLSRQGLGLALVSMGRPSEAVIELARAVRLMPNAADPHYNLGVALQAASRIDAALASFEAALTLDARHADAAYAVGVVREQRGETAPAARAFRLALEVRPGWTPALTELAWTLAVSPDPASRQPAEALRLARTVSSQPGAADARATEVLAAAQAAAGLFDDAVASARAALALLPPEASSALRRAMEDRLDLYRRREPFYAESSMPR